MIEKKYLIEEESKDYLKYNYFEISEGLDEILRDGYFKYSTDNFSDKDKVEELFKKNFLDKYDRDKQPEVFQLYIDNKKFKEKVLFIYSMIDEEKYKLFVQKQEEITNPNDLYIKYSILDSQNTKVLMYNITITDIAFVF